MELPFKLAKYHKPKTLWNWKREGLIESDEQIEFIYTDYIYGIHCDLCGEFYKNTLDRQMEHCHETGEFRNIVCRSCNQRKADIKIQSNNTSGFVGIYKHKSKNCKQGYIWRFLATINGKNKSIKTSIDYDKLVAFSIQWKIDNKYHT
tara:strand:- start:628 stop:1071 length:444 start_codon:yes stop_codon:yes gene_type:complete